MPAFSILICTQKSRSLLPRSLPCAIIHQTVSISKPIPRIKLRNCASESTTPLKREAGELHLGDSQVIDPCLGIETDAIYRDSIGDGS